MEDKRKKVWIVSVRTEIAVLAETERDAEIVAMDNADEEMTNGLSTTAEASVILDVDDIPDEFRGTIPWGSDDDRLIEEYLDQSWAEARKPW